MPFYTFSTNRYGYYLILRYAFITSLKMLPTYISFVFQLSNMNACQMLNIFIYFTYWLFDIQYLILLLSYTNINMTIKIDMFYCHFFLKF